MERIAIIDLGSNSIRFLIKEIYDDFTFKLIFKDKKNIRLAENMGKNSTLSESAIKRAVYHLKVYSEIISIYKIDKVFAIATAAVRNASNKDYFLQLVKKETGIILDVIDGNREAYLGFLGVSNTINKKDFLMFDLGGASIEISLIKNKKIINSISLPLGAVNLTENFKLKEDYSSKKIKSVQNFIQKQIKSIKWLPKEPITLIGIGGTIRNLAKIHQNQICYPLNKLHNYTFEANSIKKVLNLISSKTPQEIKEIPGLSSERSDIILGGTIIVSELINKLNVKELTISTSGLREGIFFEYYNKIYNSMTVQSSDMLISSAINYKKTVLTNKDNLPDNVSNLSLSIFDKLVNLHKLPKSSRKLLNVASMLYNIGLKIDYFNLYKHTFYISMNSSIVGWSHLEQIKTSFISSFCKGFSGKTLKNSPFFKLLNENDINEIKILSLILSIAEKINFNTGGTVKNIDIKETKELIIVHIDTPYKTLKIPNYNMSNIKRYFYKIFNKTLLLKSK